MRGEGEGRREEGGGEEGGEGGGEGGKPAVDARGMREGGQGGERRWGKGGTSEDQKNG